MSGQDGNRGYLIQTVIALLESLNHPDWDLLTIEPTHTSDKIDILWSGASWTRASQVKSSINQINLTNAKKWAAELEAQATADELTLILVGPCSESVARMKDYGKVLIPCPKSPDFEGLLGLAAHLLDRFLEQENISAQSPRHRELMVRALTTELSIFASSGTPFNRDQFVSLLKRWIKGIAAPTNQKWELVDFSQQRGIESAIAGKRLGPADVDQCPEFPICRQVAIELERSHWYSLVGQPGCGKSITAWQVAKKFHDAGYSVWRPHYDAETSDLLKSLPIDSPAVLVVDDAQQYGAGFVERLSERSCKTLKVIFASTLAEIVTPNPSCISPKSGVDKLKTSMLERRDEVMPIVQRFDRRVSDSYLSISFERRVNDCARQKTPWEFFWVLRGGWQTAHPEYESLKQVPNANALLTTIALCQIASCDAGLSKNRLFHIAEELGLTVHETYRVVSHLASLDLVMISDDVFRTKHISYAYRVVDESLHSNNYEQWHYTIEILKYILRDHSISLKGCYWLLNAIQMTDAPRSTDWNTLQPEIEPLIRRCLDEWPQNEWAVGCVLRISRTFDRSILEIVANGDLLLRLFTAGTGMIAYFGNEVASQLINSSDKEGIPETTDVAKSIFEKVDSERLVTLANGLTLDDFYSFGSLLNCLLFYRPSWSETFLAQFDWPRVLKIISNADASYADAVDKLVGAVSLLRSTDPSHIDLRYVEEILPFMVRAISEDPINTIESMQDLFWIYLGLAPRFLRSCSERTDKQIVLAQQLVAQLDPTDFAMAMRHIVSRDMENLARSLAVVYEVDPDFIQRVASLVPEEEFYAATQSDWRTQSSELQHLLGFFCIGEERQPARSWIARNEKVIQGPLETVLAGIAPQVAVNFFKDGRGVKLTEKYQHRWDCTMFAIYGIAEVDKSVCMEIVSNQLDKLESALYDHPPDSPREIVQFFRLLHQLSHELFSHLVQRLNVDDPKAQKTLNQLVRFQPKKCAAYKKLAKLACRTGGDLGVFGQVLLSRLEESPATIRMKPAEG